MWYHGIGVFVPIYGEFFEIEKIPTIRINYSKTDLRFDKAFSNLFQPRTSAHHPLRYR